MSNALSSPQALLTVNANSTQVNILSIARIAVGVTSLIAPTFISQKVWGFTQRTAQGSSASASTTTPKAGSPEESTLGIRLAGTRDLIFGLLLRDPASAVVERALQLGLINSVLDIVAVGIGYVEGSLSREVATAVGGAAAIFTAFQAYILNR